MLNNIPRKRAIRSDVMREGSGNSKSNEVENFSEIRLEMDLLTIKRIDFYENLQKASNEEDAATWAHLLDEALDNSSFYLHTWLELLKSYGEGSGMEKDELGGLIAEYSYHLANVRNTLPYISTNSKVSLYINEEKLDNTYTGFRKLAEQSKSFLRELEESNACSKWSRYVR